MENRGPRGRDAAQRHAAAGAAARALDPLFGSRGEGQRIAEVGWFWEHADNRPVRAHASVMAHEVCTSGTHDALACRRFRKQADGEAHGAARPASATAGAGSEGVHTGKRPTELCKTLVEGVEEQNIPGAVTGECYVTNAEMLNQINRKGRGEVGDLTCTRTGWCKGRERKASALAAAIGPASRQPVTSGDHTPGSFTKTLQLPEVDQAVRIVLRWHREHGKEAVKRLVTTRVSWEITRLLKRSRKRGTGTETFHRDGKQPLGLGDGPLRNGEGQTRPRYLVMLTHRRRVSDRRQGRVREWAQRMLTTVGEACRAVLREPLGKTTTWAIARATADGWSHEHMKAHLALV